jgi:predicted secreted protein
VALAVLAAAAAPALAGDRSLAEVIGYSPDGRYFAFEELGIHDGSGLAYSTIFVLDLEADAWVGGTPIRVRAEAEEQRLPAIRAEATAKAAEALAQFGIEKPAEVLAMIGDGAVDGGDGTRLGFGLPGYQAGRVAERYELRLTSFPATAPSPCKAWFGAEPLGYELVLVEGEEEQIIHRDDRLPESRGCPLAYRLYGVVVPFDAGSLEDAVALISVYPGGFEGPDRRFVAVPLEH